jgi:hypothetical protein
MRGQLTCGAGGEQQAGQVTQAKRMVAPRAVEPRVLFRWIHDRVAESLERADAHRR